MCCQNQEAELEKNWLELKVWNNKLSSKKRPSNQSHRSASFLFGFQQVDSLLQILPQWAAKVILGNVNLTMALPSWNSHVVLQGFWGKPHTAWFWTESPSSWVCTVVLRPGSPTWLLSYRTACSSLKAHSSLLHAPAPPPPRCATRVHFLSPKPSSLLSARLNPNHLFIQIVFQDLPMSHLL